MPLPITPQAPPVRNDCMLRALVLVALTLQTTISCAHWSLVGKLRLVEACLRQPQEQKTTRHVRHLAKVVAQLVLDDRWDVGKRADGGTRGAGTKRHTRTPAHELH